MKNHMKLGVVAGAMVVTAFVASAMTAGASMAGPVGVLAGWFGGGIGQLAAIGIVLALVAVPVLIANTRSHRLLLLVAVLATLGTLPVVGWVLWTMALMLAAGTHPSPEPVRPAAVVVPAGRSSQALPGHAQVPVTI